MQLKLFLNLLYSLTAIMAWQMRHICYKLNLYLNSKKLCLSRREFFSGIRPPIIRAPVASMQQEDWYITKRENDWVKVTEKRYTCASKWHKNVLENVLKNLVECRGKLRQSLCWKLKCDGRHTNHGPFKI